MIKPGRPTAPGKQPGAFVFKALIFGGAGLLALTAAAAPMVLDVVDALALGLLALLAFTLGMALVA